MFAIWGTENLFSSFSNKVEIFLPNQAIHNKPSVKNHFWIYISGNKIEKNSWPQLQGDNFLLTLGGHALDIMDDDFYED